VKSQFCSKIAFVAAGFSLRSRRRMAYCFSQAKACGYRLGLFTNESNLLQKSGKIIAEIFDDNMASNESETTIELNFAVLKFKHTIKKTTKK
ncbi:MAG: hypothetical protein ABH843_05930, partial [Candidatus Omnitrophota bacterium]